ncbi:hypothetical protein LJR219_001154 [Phenylobacterium sp. LjRoot219]|uniref:hypothetical protein n=1 Tax=Phenylobacterium sp. LjRoot219 TaxID=3342283 RepID=UPI003ECC3F80
MARFDTHKRSATIPAAGWLAGFAAAAGLGAPACAQQVLVQKEGARLALEPYGAASKLGSRAEIAAQQGPLDASLAAALERGGGRLNLGDSPAGVVQVPSAWRSETVRFQARWAVAPDAELSVAAENGERRAYNAMTPLGAAGDGQLTRDDTRSAQIRAVARLDQLEAQVGAEEATAAFRAQADDAALDPSRHWLASRRLFAKLAWRPSDRFSVEAGQAAQSFTVGWRGPETITSSGAYLTPNVAVALKPWARTTWRLDAEQTLTPIQPGQFAAYAQLATAGAGAAPQPDRGRRYGARIDQDLGGGARLGAGVSDWRMASVTELGPVGAGEAPISIGPGDRQQLDVNLTAPLTPLGLAGATLAGDLTLRRSQVIDPFTGERRAFSGESPYRAQLRLSGALAATDLSWSVVAQADGPQALHQMSQVTNLGATAGLGGALSYGAGPVTLSLEVENLVGGSREVTTYSFAGSRADAALADVIRRNDETRAVRISLKRPL